MNGCWVQPQTAGSDGQMSLSDLETVKVIGKGSGGVVQLVRHKWTNSIYALKVIYCLDGLLLFIFIWLLGLLNSNGVHVFFFQIFRPIRLIL